MKRFREGLVFKAHRLLYHSTLGLRVIKKKKKVTDRCEGAMQHAVTPPVCPSNSASATPDAACVRYHSTLGLKVIHKKKKVSG